MSTKNSNPKTVATRPAGGAVSPVTVPIGETITTEMLAGYAIEHVVSLEEGKGLRGRFLGEGAPMDFADEETGEVRTIKTWRVEVAPNKVARLMGSAGLDKHLDGHAPGQCVIVRGPQVNTRKGRRVNSFMVGWGE